MKTTTDFINSLKCSDLQSFVLVLQAYNSHYETRNLNIENIGFNTYSGYVYFHLENDITIASCFGQPVEYIVTNNRNGEENLFDTYSEAINFLKYGEEEEEEII
jgi:hypothetical protein